MARTPATWTEHLGLDNDKLRVCHDFKLSSTAMDKHMDIPLPHAYSILSSDIPLKPNGANFFTKTFPSLDGLDWGGVAMTSRDDFQSEHLSLWMDQAGTDDLDWGGVWRLCAHSDSILFYSCGSKTILRCGMPHPHLVWLVPLLFPYCSL